MLAMPSTCAPASRSTLTTSMTLPPVEMRVLDDHDFLALFQFALDLVAAAVVLGPGTHVAHGQAEDVGGDGGVGDAGGGGAHQHFAVRVVVADGFARPFSTSRRTSGAVRVRRLSQ